MSDYFDMFKYDDFLFYFEDSDLSEDEFEIAMNSLIELNIMDYNSYADSIKGECVSKWDYVPLSDRVVVVVAYGKEA